MSTSVRVQKLPACDLCAGGPAAVDGRTQAGPWANMCPACYVGVGVGLGAGKGQLLILSAPAAPNRDDWDQRFAAWLAKVNAECEAICGLPADCLADWGLADAFNDGMDPADAAAEVIANDGTFAGLM